MLQIEIRSHIFLNTTHVVGIAIYIIVVTKTLAKAALRTTTEFALSLNVVRDVLKWRPIPDSVNDTWIFHQKAGIRQQADNTLAFP